MRWIREHTPWEMDVLLADGGELTGEFAKLGNTFILPEWSPRWTPEAVRARLARRRMLSRLRSGAWSLVYSNTATNGEMLEIVGGQGPVISHVHELAPTIRTYGPDNIDSVRRHTTRYIACSEAVKSDLTSEWRIEPAAVDVWTGSGNWRQHKVKI